MNEPATEGAVEIPLESLPNILDDDTHKYLDEKVLNHFTPLFESFTTLKELEAILLLMGIISESQNRLNPDYETILPAKALLENHPELVDKLRGAWRERSFKEIRNLSTYNYNDPPDAFSAFYIFSRNFPSIYLHRTGPAW